MSRERRAGRGLFIAVLSILAGYVVWDRAEVYRLNRDIKEIAARGEPVDLSYRDAPLENAQDRESAQLYADGAAAAQQMLDRDYRLSRIDFDSVSGVPVTPADLEQTFRLDCPALQLLDRASTLPFHGMGEFAPDYYYENGSTLQGLSGLSALRADVLAYRGDADGAAAAIVSALSVQRTLPGVFYRATAGGRVFGSLRILLRHTTPSEASLRTLQHAFEALPDDDGLEVAVRDRRALVIAHLDDPVDGLVPKAVSLALHPYLTALARQQLEEYDDVARAVRQPWPAKADALSAMMAEATSSARLQRLRWYLPRAAYPAPAVLAADYRSAAANLAIRRVAIATLAVERYRRAHDGAPPPSLAVLAPAFISAVPVDPLSGQPLIYRQESDAYVVYGVDANRKDDGGALYGFGSHEPVAASMRSARDFGIRVPLTPRRGAQ